MGMKEERENEDGMNDIALLFYTGLSVKLLQMLNTLIRNKQSSLTAKA